MNKQQWDQLGEIICSYIDNSINANAVDYISASDLIKKVPLEIPANPGDFDKVLSFVKTYLNSSVNTLSPKFSNQLYGGLTTGSFVGEIITAITNTSMATYEIAPFASLIEKKLIEYLSGKVGWDKHDGIMLTGGSNANMMALIAARNTRFPSVKDNGLKQSICAFISDQAHYSFKKAFHIMGLGEENLIKVKSDELGKMIPEDLNNKIEEVKKQGKTPFFIGATAGTTVYGAFDPIKELKEIADQHNCWFHIDGAWGGSILLSSQADLLKGCHLADSFTWDAHKMLNVPIICSFFLTKHEGILKELNSGGGSKYIFHNYSNKKYDTGPHSLQCGRKVDSLKLYLTFLEYGEEGIKKNLDHLYNEAQKLSKLIEESDDFELILSPESMNVCFRYIDTKQDLNDFNLQLRTKLVEDGEYLVNYSNKEDGTIFFRQIFVNPAINIKYSKALLNKIRELSKL